MSIDARIDKILRDGYDLSAWASFEQWAQSKCSGARFPVVGRPSDESPNETAILQLLKRFIVKRLLWSVCSWIPVVKCTWEKRVLHRAREEAENCLTTRRAFKYANSAEKFVHDWIPANRGRISCRRAARIMGSYFEQRLLFSNLLQLFISREVNWNWKLGGKKSDFFHWRVSPVMQRRRGYLVELEVKDEINSFYWTRQVSK